MGYCERTVKGEISVSHRGDSKDGRILVRDAVWSGKHNSLNYLPYDGGCMVLLKRHYTTNIFTYRKTEALWILGFHERRRISELTRQL